MRLHMARAPVVIDDQGNDCWVWWSISPGVSGKGQSMLQSVTMEQGYLSYGAF